jgi:hypothetical protein
MCAIGMNDGLVTGLQAAQSKNLGSIPGNNKSF